MSVIASFDSLFRDLSFVATRNEGDFKYFDVEVFNPFKTVT